MPGERRILDQKQLLKPPRAQIGRPVSGCDKSIGPLSELWGVTQGIREAQARIDAQSDKARSQTQPK